MSEQFNPTENSQHWYIVKDQSGTCNVLWDDRLETQNDVEIVARWGPFSSSQEAIARRIGLIRAGKCQPR
ncbi:DDE transposase family protein [Oscillatoriales cyanobacterium LEGE 11467]|uniref:DDE transposase family protein n=1 Tax=Zarconia navalis LEGE 11467 TaxID=1828826 RepID=A0A928VWF7_9CYAN|nr:DDE transposase family protein [Zarconia navalis]MBE9040799.1 DDE transposase family protein [Zarconia navalis LEGE 11467]